MSRSFARVSEQYLEVTNTPVTSAPFTMSIWFNVVDLDQENFIFSIADKDVSNNYWYIYTHTSGDLRFIAYDATTIAYCDTSTTFSPGTWNHACAIEAASNDRTIYLNAGGPENNTQDTSPANADRITIGTSADSSEAGFTNGLLAEAAIYNVALTLSEITSLSKGISPLAIRPGNLVFYCPLIRDNDQDVIGGLSLTAINSPTIGTHPPIRYPFTPFYYMTTGAEPPADLSIDIGLDEAAYQGTGVRII